ncbi:hypothetical protein MKW92_049910 [Papaver armeniacum]|nr:hypothetical protein MKW92_049910 [Papaver armeniacum]
MVVLLLTHHLLLFSLCLCLIHLQSISSKSIIPPPPSLRFDENGKFKILQVADMHYADGITTPCKDVLPDQFKGCSDLSTTHFLNRMIKAENPDFIVFTGKLFLLIYQFGIEFDAAFAPAVASGIPWATVLGNHEKESTLSREGVMKHIDGFGNYNLEVGRIWLDQNLPINLKAFMNKPEAQKDPAPALAYFHIPLPEYTSQGMLKQVFMGHDHVNDIYGELIGIHLCYDGGFELTTLEKTEKGGWGYVKYIRTWKRLDDEHLTPVDAQILWTKSSVSKSL